MTREITVNLRELDGPTEPKNRLKKLSELIAFLAVLSGFVFSLGWSYAYKWFALWGIPFSGVGLDAGSYFEYGRIVIASYKYYIIPVVACILLVSSVSFVRSKLPPWTCFLLSPQFVAIAALVAWVLCHALGSASANNDFQESSKTGNWAQLPAVSVLFKEGATIPSSFLDDAELGIPCYRLVISSADAIWLARTIDNKLDPIVVMVPKDEVRMLILFPKVGNCTA